MILVEGDTKAFDWGVATFASRAAVVSGNAIHKTAVVVREKTLKAAANMLDVAVDDVELRDGAAWVKGSNRFVPLAAVATATIRYVMHSTRLLRPQHSLRPQAAMMAPPSRRAGARS